jgi:hypothetical protein
VFLFLVDQSCGMEFGKGQLYSLWLCKSASVQRRFCSGWQGFQNLRRQRIGIVCSIVSHFVNLFDAILANLSGRIICSNTLSRRCCVFSFRNQDPLENWWRWRVASAESHSGAKAAVGLIFGPFPFLGLSSFFEMKDYGYSCDLYIDRQEEVLSWVRR